jgi:hypothetical protein
MIYSDLETLENTSQAEGRGFESRIPLSVDNQQVKSFSRLKKPPFLAMFQGYLYRFLWVIIGCYKVIFVTNIVTKVPVNTGLVRNMPHVESGKNMANSGHNIGHKNY